MAEEIFTVPIDQELNRKLQALQIKMITSKDVSASLSSVEKLLLVSFKQI